MIARRPRPVRQPETLERAETVKPVQVVKLARPGAAQAGGTVDTVARAATPTSEAKLGKPEALATRVQEASSCRPVIRR